MHGKGHLSWPDGREYKGEFFEDKRHGFGEFLWKDGRKYTGEWQMGKQHGVGVMQNNAGDKGRKGEWQDGKRTKWCDDK